MIFIWLLNHLILVSGQIPKKPNIVVIVADDLGYQDVGFRGSYILTPNIDKLAKEGVILENHYVTPACSPTRASLMSGRHAIRTGFWRGNVKPSEEWGLRLNETTLPEMLKRNGYSTHGVGKWHCGMYTWEHTPAKRGFDTFFGLYLGAQKYFTHKRSGILDFRFDYHDENGKFVDEIRPDLEGKYNTRLFSDKAVEHIEGHDQTKPLFLYLAYTAPHNPYQVPKDDINRYAKNIRRKPSRDRVNYAAMVSVMDEGIGKVVESLKQTDMLKNTLIVFLSDNGAVYGANGQGSNYPLRGGKHSLFEGGVRSVSWVNSPLLKKTRYTNKHLIDVTDWYVTFQKMAGDEPEKHSKPQLPLDGRDMWDTISQDRPGREEILVGLYIGSMFQNSKDHEFLVKRDDSVIMKHDDRFAIRWKNWKLLTGTFLSQGWIKKNQIHKDTIQTDEYKDSSKERKHKPFEDVTMLFDLSKDPREINNIAAEFPDVVQTMMEKITAYIEKMTKVNRGNSSRKGRKSGVWKPWVEIVD